MEKKFKDIVADLFLKQGFSCSETMVQAAFELGLVPKELVNTATAFSGGMASKCLCGAVSGSQIILGYLCGKYKSNTARALGKEFYEKFTAKNKVTCCKILTKDFVDFHSPERKAHCVKMVLDAAEILDEMMIKIKEEALV